MEKKNSDSNQVLVMVIRNYDYFSFKVPGSTHKRKIKLQIWNVFSYKILRRKLKGRGAPKKTGQ